MPKRGLGRGLEAILGAAVSSTEELREVPVGDIYPNPNQPRAGFDREKLDELAASIKEHGIVQPILVRPFGDRFELVAGERRWRAAQAAGLSAVPAMVRSLSDRQSLEIALIENLQREDLNPLEEAHAFQAMMELMDLTQEQVAERLGVSRPAISNALRLLNLPETVLARVAAGALSAGHARALVGLAEPVAAALAQRVADEELTVRQVEAMVRGLADGESAASANRQPRQRAVDPDVEAIERQLRAALGTEVKLQRKRRGGQLVIRYFSAEELERLVELLAGLDVPAAGP